MVPTLQQLILSASLSGIVMLLQGCGSSEPEEGKKCVAVSYGVTVCGDDASDEGCKVSFACINDKVYRLPNSKCADPFPVPVPDAQIKTCADFEAWDVTE